MTEFVTIKNDNLLEELKNSKLYETIEMDEISIPKKYKVDNLNIESLEEFDTLLDKLRFWMVKKLPSEVICWLFTYVQKAKLSDMLKLKRVLNNYKDFYYDLLYSIINGIPVDRDYSHNDNLETKYNKFKIDNVIYEDSNYPLLIDGFKKEDSQSILEHYQNVNAIQPLSNITNHFIPEEGIRFADSIKNTVDIDGNTLIDLIKTSNQTENEYEDSGSFKEEYSKSETYISGSFILNYLTQGNKFKSKDTQEEYYPVIYKGMEEIKTGSRPTQKECKQILKDSRLWFSKDIDIFTNDEDFVKDFKKSFPQLHESIVYDHMYNFNNGFSASPMQSECYEITNDMLKVTNYTNNNQKMPKHVQIILLKDNVKDYLKRFDFEFVQSYFDGSNFHLRNITSILSRTSTIPTKYTNKRTLHKELSRVKKYGVKRQYNIVLPKVVSIHKPFDKDEYDKKMKNSSRHMRCYPLGQHHFDPVTVNDFYKEIDNNQMELIKDIQKDKISDDDSDSDDDY